MYQNGGLSISPQSQAHPHRGGDHFFEDIDTSGDGVISRKEWDDYRRLSSSNLSAASRPEQAGSTIRRPVLNSYQQEGTRAISVLADMAAEDSYALVEDLVDSLMAQ